MGLTMNELARRVARESHRVRSRLKSNYNLARRLGFSSTEAVILQSHKREVILKLALERGLITDINDPKAA